MLKAFPGGSDGKRSVSMSSVWRRHRLLAVMGGFPQVSGTAFLSFVAKAPLRKFLEELGIELGRRLGGLRDILAQDGTVAVVSPQAAARAPESFKDSNSKGGLKTHAAWSLASDTHAASPITSAVSSERDEIRMDRVKGSLIICDAGYPSTGLF